MGLLMTHDIVNDDGASLPAAPPDARYFVLSHSAAGGDKDHPHLYWVEDRTIYTDSVLVAYIWAVRLAGVSEITAAARPLARISALRLDPYEDPYTDDDEEPGTVIAYVTPDGDVTDEREDDFDALHAECETWAVLLKACGPADRD